MDKSAELVTGWAKHQAFGLRQEWLQLYFTHPQTWAVTGGLGNRQVQSMKAWLMTAGLRDSRDRETILAEIFRREGLDASLPWELLWVNVVFSFPTAAWYVKKFGLGEWTTTEIKSILCSDVPQMASRTAQNGVMELVGLLERTPVGGMLGQGEVMPSRPRRVRRAGWGFPSREAVFHATRRLFARERKERLALEENVLWPWTAFGCDRKYVLQELILHGADRFTVTGEYVWQKEP